MTRYNRIIVPRHLRDITTVGQECAPEEAGLSRPKVTILWKKIEAQFRSGLHPAISVVLRRRGRVVHKLAETGTIRLDRTMMLPLRWSSGLMLGRPGPGHRRDHPHHRQALSSHRLAAAVRHGHGH